MTNTNTETRSRKETAREAKALLNQAIENLKRLVNDGAIVDLLREAYIYAGKDLDEVFEPLENLAAGMEDLERVAEGLDEEEAERKAEAAQSKEAIK